MLPEEYWILKCFFSIPIPQSIRVWFPSRKDNLEVEIENFIRLDKLN